MLVQVVPAIAAAIAPSHVHVIEPASVVGAVAVDVDGVSGGALAQVDGGPDGDGHGTAGVQAGADGIHGEAPGGGAGAEVKEIQGVGTHVAGGFPAHIAIVVDANGHAGVPHKAADHLVVFIAALLEVGLGAAGAGVVGHEGPVVGSPISVAAHGDHVHLVGLLHHVVAFSHAHGAGEGAKALLGPLEIANHLGHGGGGAPGDGVVGVALFPGGPIHGGSGGVIVVAGVGDATVGVGDGALGPLGLGEVGDPDVLNGGGLPGAGLGGGVLRPLVLALLVVFRGFRGLGAAELLLGALLVGQFHAPLHVTHHDPAEGIGGGGVEGAFPIVEEDRGDAVVTGDNHEALRGEIHRVAIDHAPVLYGDGAGNLTGKAVRRHGVPLAGKPTLRQAKGSLLPYRRTIQIHAKNQRKCRNSKTNEPFQHLRFS